jgi:DNA-binding XRE family transcriptional regulator
MVAGTIEIEGKRFVVLPQQEYEQLMARRAANGEDDLPTLPKPLANGNFDAIAFARASLARKMILDRRASGLSQAELARRSHVRVETLNRIERCKLTPSIATVDKLDRAMKTASNGLRTRAVRGSRKKLPASATRRESKKFSR